MKPWLSTEEAREFTGLSNYALRQQADLHPEILMDRPGAYRHRRYRAARLAAVLGLSAEEAEQRWEQLRDKEAETA